MDEAGQRIIVALDNLAHRDALKLVEETSCFASIYKVGLSLFLAQGPAIIKDIKSLGVDIFLDLKFHDIPMQVAGAVMQALKYEPRFLTVHALGGAAMMAEAARAAHDSPTKLLAVTILTSIDQTEWRGLGFDDIAQSADNLANKAMNSHISGLVASPHEAQRLKHRYGSRCFLVCPGVRGPEDPRGDQARFMTSAQAIRAGADAIVVGRPITQAADPARAARLINLEVAEALALAPGEKIHA